MVGVRGHSLPVPPPMLLPLPVWEGWGVLGGGGTPKKEKKKLLLAVAGSLLSVPR